MFRNPRENATRDPHSSLTPSVGRPPSPDFSSSPGRRRQRDTPVMASKTTSRSSATSQYFTPRRTSSGKEGTGTPPAPSSATSKSTKAKPKQNASILSFFKKADSSANEALFVEDQASNDFQATGIGEQNMLIGSDMDMDFVTEKKDGQNADNDVRYHELGNSIKRRKFSDSSKENDATAFDRPTGNPDEIPEPCTPPPPDFDEEANTAGDKTAPEDSIERQYAHAKASVNHKQRGGFVIEPDSEEEEAAEVENKDDEVRSQLVQHLPENESKTVPTREESLLSEKANAEPPQLRREPTSIPEGGDFEGFEGMEDEDVDEYAEGEEYSERKWMAHQRRLEMSDGFEGEVDDEDLVSIKEEFEDEYQGSREPELADPIETPSCPICSIDLAHLSPQDVSVHVNSCPDGNPTPVPDKQENEPKSEAMKTEPSISAARFQRPNRPAKPGQENPFTLGTANNSSSAFSKLMSGHAEDAAWATAAAAEHSSRGKPAYQRTCPFYKILPGFFICVDAFRYGAVQGCNAYFLSHFHSDHYIGLTATWTHGPIYCSTPTANLVKQQLRVDPQYVVPLEFDKKIEVPGTRGVFVTMIPANHCPGSSLYLFEKAIGKGNNPKMQRVLHCGDFRACPAHIEHPLLKPEIMDNLKGKTIQQKIDVCYLDTTYLNPKYAFPSQEDVIQACADMCVSLSKSKVDENDGWEQTKKERAGGSMAKFVRKDSKAESDNLDGETNSSVKTDTKTSRGRLLVVVGTYSIGKERICLGIARALRSKIYAPPGKQRICAALQDAELNAYLTSDPRDAQVHMTPLFEIRAETLGDYLSDYRDCFSRAVGFRPSGWNYRPPGSRFTESPAVSTVLHSDSWKSGYSMKDLVSQRGSTSRSSCYGVPYSEHSSFRELTMFCCALNIEKVIPTVNVGSAKSRERMKLWCERWAVERKKNGLFQVDKRDDGTNNWYPGKGTWELKTTL